MILYINTSQKQKFELGLYNNKKNKLVLKSIKTPVGTMSERFLPELDKFLKDNPPASPKLSFGGRGNTNIKRLTSIIIFQGPGSYTSLRIGISIANALAWSLDIPIVGIKMQNLNLILRRDSGCPEQCRTGKSQSYNSKLKNVLSKKIKRIIKQKHFTESVKPYYSNKI